MDKPIENNVIKQLGLTSYEMSTSVGLAHRAFNALLKTCLSHYNLTMSQWKLLGHLYTNGVSRPYRIASILETKPSMVAKILSELQNMDLVVVEVHPDDERGKSILLNETGTRLVEQVESKLEVCLNDQFKSLDRRDVETYFSLTRYIAQNVHHQ